MKLKHILFSGILLGLLLIPGICSADTLYEENFESYAAGSTTLGSVAFSGKVLEEDGNKYASFEHFQTMKPYFTVTGGKVTVSVDAMMTKVGAARIICLWDASDSLRSGRLHVVGTNFVLTRSDGKNTALAPIEANKWYNIVMELDYNAQKVTQVYINGKATLSEPADFYDHEKTVANAAATYFCLDANDGTLCIDNIKIEENRYPELNAAFNEAKGLLLSKRGTAAGEYPSSSFTMLGDVVAEAEKAMKAEGFGEGEAAVLKDKLAAAVKRFKESVIQGGVSYTYQNDFERYSENSSPTGFLVANNTKIEQQGGSKAAHITGQGRLLYSHSPAVTTNLVLTMRFMQPNKNTIPYLFCTSGRNGSNALIKVFSNGTDLLTQKADGSSDVVLANYKAGTWYSLKAEIYLADQEYVLSYAEEDGPWVEAGRFDFWMNDTSIERFFDVRYVNGDSNNNIYVDDFTAAPITTAAIANDANSIAISGAPAYLSQGDDAWLTAAVYDKFYKLWSNQSLTWNTSEGLVIEADGHLTVEEGFEGKARVIAQTASGLYEAVDVICLPKGSFSDTAAAVSNGKLTVRGIINMAKYVKTTVKATITGEKAGSITTATATVEPNETGAFTLSVKLPDGLLTQELTIALIDDESGATDTLTCYVYGDDAAEVFLAELKKLKQQGQSLTGLLESYQEICGLKLDAVYEAHKDIYNSKLLAHDDFETLEACREYIEEIRLLISVQFATRDSIDGIVQDGLALLEKNGLSENFSALSDNNYETFLLNVMGVTADSLTTLVNTMNGEIKALTTAAAGGSNSHSGGGGGGGGTAPKRTETGAAAVKTVDVVKTEKESGVTQPEAADDFVDSGQANWAKEAISKLKKLGVMVGDGNYVYPNRTVTRAEFAKLLKLSFKLSDEGTADFVDFDASAWWADSVKTVAAAGIINGYEDGSFRPNDAVRREEAAVMLARTIEKCGLPVYKKQLDGSFGDDAAISDYAKESVYDMRAYGVMSGQGNNSFVPQASVTRAEAAVMLVNLLSFYEAE